MPKETAETTKIINIGDGSALPLRGGSWWNSGESGVFALAFDNSRVGSNLHVGFRAAFLSSRMSGAHGLQSRAGRQKGHVPLPIRQIGNLKYLLGTGRRFLCAAAPSSTVERRACSRSCRFTRATSPQTTLVSAPLFSRAGCSGAHGPRARAGRQKGPAPLPI